MKLAGGKRETDERRKKNTGCCDLERRSARDKSGQVWDKEIGKN